MHYAGFQDAHIPFLFYNNGRNEHYHATTDTPEFLDFGKMMSLVEHLTAVVAAAANSPVDTFQCDTDGADHGSTIETISAVLPALPQTSRFAEQAPTLLNTLAERHETNGLKAGEWQIPRRIFNAIEDGLQDQRPW